MTKLQNFILGMFTIGLIELIFGVIGALKTVAWDINLVTFLLITGAGLVSVSTIFSAMFPIKNKKNE